MTFLQLEYFRITAKLGSMSAAAEQLYLTPAALSRAIKQLEEEIGQNLFDRQGRHIKLNETGRIFLLHAEEALDTMEVAKRRISALSQGRRSFLRVRLDVLLDEPGTLPVALQKARPSLSIETIPPSRSGARYDVRFFSSQSRLADSAGEYLLSDRMVAALPLQHPLAQRDEIPLASLAAEPFILCRADGHDATLRNMCAEVGFSPIVGLTFSAESYGGIFRAVREGLGCSIVPEKAWRAEYGTAHIALVPFSDIICLRHIYCSYPPGTPPSEETRFVVDFVKNLLLQAG